MKNIYLLLSLLGTVIPCYFLGFFFLQQGLDIWGFLSAPFASNASSAFTADLLISAGVFGVWVFSQKDVDKPWLYILLMLAVGLSCALPFFLYQREKFLEKTSGIRA
jgi:Sec-independent protein secretion pathway component TatC